MAVIEETSTKEKLIEFILNLTNEEYEDLDDEFEDDEDLDMDLDFDVVNDMDSDDILSDEF